jgi:hypothetical protein
MCCLLLMPSRSSEDVLRFLPWRQVAVHKSELEIAEGILQVAAAQSLPRACFELSSHANALRPVQVLEAGFLVCGL